MCGSRYTYVLDTEARGLIASSSTLQTIKGRGKFMTNDGSLFTKQPSVIPTGGMDSVAGGVGFSGGGGYGGYVSKEAFQ